MVPCHPVGMFSPVRELLSFTSNSAKSGVVWEGGDHDHEILCAIITFIRLRNELGISSLVLFKVGLIWVIARSLLLHALPSCFLGVAIILY
jgi:hypothetical protein